MWKISIIIDIQIHAWLYSDYEYPEVTMILYLVHMLAWLDPKAMKLNFTGA